MFKFFKPSGAQISWDDLKVPLNAVKLAGVKDPLFEQFKNDGATSTGVYLYSFTNTAVREVFFVMQLPHEWEKGTAIKPHLHWIKNSSGAGEVVWKMEYTVATVAGDFGNTTTITGATPVHLGTEAADNHMISAFPDIETTGLNWSAMYVCRVYRDTDDGGDTYADKAWLLEVDFHFQKRHRGTIYEYSDTV